MLRLFTSINFFSILLLPLFVVGYFLLAQNFSPSSYIFDSQITFNLGVFGELPIDKLQNTLTCSILLLLNAIFINKVFNTRNFIEKTTLLPGFLYLVLMTNTREATTLDGALIFHLFLIGLINILSQLTFNKQNHEAAFNSGFLASAGAVFFPAFYPMMPLIYFIMLFQIPFKLREVLLFIGGCLVPQLFVLFYLYISHQLSFAIFYQWFAPSYSIPFNYFFDVLLLAFTSFTTLITSRITISYLNLKQKKTTLGFVLLLFFLSVSAFGIYFFFSNTLYLHLIIIPLAFLFSLNLLKNHHSFVQLTMFFVLLTFSYLKFFFA